jgi:hypothetical protein
MRAAQEKATLVRQHIMKSNPANELVRAFKMDRAFRRIGREKPGATRAG